MERSRPYIHVTDHVEMQWYKRVEVTTDRPHEKMRRWFREAIPVGLDGTGKQARYHPPSGIVFIYASRDSRYELITLYRYGPQSADIISMDHLAQCSNCENLIDPAETDGECRWCGDETAGFTPVPKLEDHPNQRKSHQNVEPKMRADIL